MSEGDNLQTEGRRKYNDFTSQVEEVESVYLELYQTRFVGERGKIQTNLERNLRKKASVLRRRRLFKRREERQRHEPHQ